MVSQIQVANARGQSTEPALIFILLVLVAITICALFRSSPRETSDGSVPAASSIHQHTDKVFSGLNNAP